MSALCLWSCLCASGAAGAQALPEVVVRDLRTHDALGLDQSAESAALAQVSVQDLPASLSAVTSSQLREREDHAVADAVARTVGLTVNATPGNGGLSFSSRGFAGVNSVGVAEDGLGLGVAAGTITYPSDAWGYERFDVLRGPASLMYGSGNMGATINAIRKAPSAQRASEVLTGVGSDGLLRGGVGTTGAIRETLTYRFDAYGQRSSGERELGRSSSHKLMSSLRWQPHADFQLDLTADVADQQPERYFGVPTVNGQAPRAMRTRNYNVTDSDVHYEDRRLRAKAQWQLAPGQSVRNEVYSTRADRHWKNIEAYTFAPASDSVGRSDYLEIGHDLQQVGNRLGTAWHLGAHQLAFGWDTAEARFTALNSSPYRGSSVVSATQPVHGLWDSPDVYQPRVTSELRQNAFYAEDAWQLDHHWLVMGGIRRDLYDFHRRDLLSDARVDTALGGTSWRLGVSRKLDAGTNVYGQFSQGHDPVTSMLSISQSQASFKLSEGRQLEVGVKQSLADGRGEWTLAAYEIRKKDIVTRDPLRPALSVQGGRQSSRGIEASGTFALSRWLRLEGNWAVTHARFDELREGATGVDRSGNRPAQVPRHTANLWTHVAQGAWSASLGLRYVGDRYTSHANTARLPAYTVADAVLRWKFSPQTSVNLAVRNLGNRFYASSASGSQWLLGAGRSAELTGHWRF